MDHKISSPYGIETHEVELPKDFPIILKRGAGVSPDLPITTLHLHGCLEVGYCDEGSGIFVVGEKVFSYHKGDIVVINSHEMHEGRTNRGSHIQHTFFWLDPLRLLGPASDEPSWLQPHRLCGPDFKNVFPSHTQPRIAQSVRNIIEELVSQSPGYRSVVRAEVWNMMTLLNRLKGVEEEPPSGQNRDALERVAPSLHYLAHHLAEPLDIPLLADVSHLSVSHFHRLFVKAVNTTPQNYLTRLRIRMASTLLASTDMPILNIAMDVGFTAMSSFNRNFRLILGASPRRYRLSSQQQRNG
jgi:AraC-like DNA-binding protein